MHYKSFGTQELGSSPKAILYSFGPQESQILKLYKGGYLHFLAMMIRSFLQKDKLKHQNFLQNNGIKQALGKSLIES
jgi:hypothetical protein